MSGLGEFINRLRRRGLFRLNEAGARNRKGDRDRLAQIIVAAFDNMSAAEQESVMKLLHDKAKPKAKMPGGKK